MKSAIWNATFKIFILSLMMIANIHFAFAQSTTQGIIPNAEATFLDSNGKPLSGGSVQFYIPGGTVPKTTYQDVNGTIPNTNPVILDAAGRALIWGTGNYRQVVKDQNNNLIWDFTTSAAGSSSSGGGSTATGDGDLVGTIKPWAGVIAPNQYLFTYGQEVSRTTYAALFTAMTSSQITFCTSGSAILTGLTDTTNFWIGMSVEISCIPSGRSTITAKTTSTVTLAVNANVTLNTTGTYFPWGDGNGSTTFNLPDLRGIIPVGNNNMGGTASPLLTTTYFGASNPNSIGALGGSQSSTLTTASLPPYTPSGTVLSGLSVSGTAPVQGQYPGTTVGGEAAVGTNNGSPLTIPLSLSGSVSSTFFGTAQGGSSAPFSILPPMKTTNYIIKVTPDANSAQASGVTALGSMTGSIACGAGVNCTGNILSVTLGPLATATVGSGLTLAGGVLSATGSNSSVIISTNQFGAVCNGSTDDTGALISWKNAINAATTTGVVGQIQPGTCILNSATLPAGLVFTRSGVTIIGNGQGGITVSGTTQVSQIFSSNDQSNMTYDGVVLTGNSVATTFALGGAIGVTNSTTNISGFTVKNSTFNNFGGDYWLYFEPLGTFSNSIQNVIVDKNTFISQNGNCRLPTNIGGNCSFVGILGVGNSGGTTTPSPNAFIRSIRVTDNFMRADYVKTGIQLFENIQDGYIAGNQIYNNGQLGGITDDKGSYAIMTYENETPSTTTYSTHVIIQGNYIFNARDNCFYMAGPWTNSIYNGNTCEYQTSTASATLPKGGISINGGLGITVVNNRLWNISGDGITLTIPTGTGSIGNKWVIEGNSVNASLNGAIKVINNAGGDIGNISITNNALQPSGTAYGVYGELFSGSTWTGLKIDNNTIAGGVYGIRLFADSGFLTTYYSSVSHNLLVTPSTAGIDLSQIQGGSMTIEGNIVTGAPTSFSYNVTNTTVLLAQDNLCINQTSGFCWITAGAQGNFINNSFKSVPAANIVQAAGGTDLGRVKPTWTASGSNVIVQNLSAAETGTAPNKFIIQSWFWNIGDTSWKDQRVLTGN